MKSHKLLYQLKNKLTWLPILILAACQNNIIYHSYAPVPLDGWDKSDTLVYTLPNSIPAGNYEAETGSICLDVALHAFRHEGKT